MPRRIYDTKAWKDLRRRVLAEARGRCEVRISGVCIGRANHVDHRQALADGGAPFDRENVRASCGPCNSHLAAKRTNEIRHRRPPPPGPSPVFDPPSREW